MGNEIMVVDDSMMVRKQVGMALTAAGFTVVEACDGVDAMEKLSTHADVALVICDINMPRMNGLEFLENVRQGLPVLMLTTEAQPELIQRATALGAKGWIMKPFKLDLVVAAARKLSAQTP
jgi:two-component system, chemotaxis family, chemotaxis protein CheY